MSSVVDKLNLDKLPDYGQGSSPVLAPDGKGVIRGGRYISLDPTTSNKSYADMQELKAFATKNTELLLAQQEFEENGTPIAETLGLKQPGDKNFDGEDRERIQEAENAAAVILREQSDLDYHKYLEKKSDDGPSAIELHNQIFGGNNAPGSIRQDEKGDFYVLTDRGTKDYSVDPQDNTQGPTFGGNVSKFVESNFPGEVAAAGGSSTFTGSILDTFKDTDVPSQGYAPVSAPAPQGNSFTQTLANIFTPFDGTKYENGVLVSTTTGFPVASTSDMAAGKEFAESMKGAGILSLGGKQIPDAPFNQGNTPIIRYTGGDDRSYEVIGGLDPNAPASMSYNEDGSLFVPYGGKDSYFFDASTNFPGSTDPSSPDYNMSKDLAETGSYYTFDFDESGAPKTDAKGNYIIDTSKKIEPGEEYQIGDKTFKAQSFDNYKFKPNIIATLNEEGKAHLLATGDDSKMIVKGPGGGYEYIDGSPVLNPSTGQPVPPYDPTGGGPIFVEGPGGGLDLVNPITLKPVYTCPTPDMLILLADNSQKPAGEIEVGDMVYTAHEDTKEWGEYEVTHKEISTDAVVKVNFDIKSITCSPSHKLFSANRDEWLEVDKLEKGDEVLTDTGEKARWVSTEPKGSGDVVVLTVEDAHTYVCEGLLSHNKSITRPPPPPPGTTPPPPGTTPPPPGTPPPSDPNDPTNPITNPGGLNSSFYGGYQPVTASDVLIANPNAEDTYFQPREARLNPMFPQGNFAPRIELFKRLGIGSLFNEPASAAMYQGIMS